MVQRSLHQTELPQTREKSKLPQEAKYLNAIHFIVMAGKLLKMPQFSIAKSAILFLKCIKRCKKKTHFDKREFFLSMACCFLGTKSEECLRNYRDVLMVYNRIYKKALKLSDSEIRQDLEFKEETRFSHWKKLLFGSEYQALYLLGHVLNYEHSYKFLLSYLNALHLDDMPAKFLQRTWNYLNDSVYSPVCAEVRPEVLAVSSINLAALEFGIPLPNGARKWHEYFDVSPSELRLCCDAVLSRYLIRTAHFDITENIREEYAQTKALHSKNVEAIKSQLEKLKLKLKDVNTTEGGKTENGVEFRYHRKSGSRYKRHLSDYRQSPSYSRRKRRTISRSRVPLKKSRSYYSSEKETNISRKKAKNEINHSHMKSKQKEKIEKSRETKNTSGGLLYSDSRIAFNKANAEDLSTQLKKRVEAEKAKRLTH